jgi:hypothetical protein
MGVGWYGGTAMSDETRKTPRRRRATEPLAKPAAPAEPDGVDGQSEDDAHLSEAARGVIRQSADPRLDAHLARMLSEPAVAPAPAAAPALAVDESATDAHELERLREELQAARAAAETARQQVQTLTWVLIVAVAAIVVLLGVAVLK